MRGSNVQVILADDNGLFIRSGTSRYRPQTSMPGVKRGQTIKAWMTTQGMKVEAPTGTVIWTKEQ